MENEKPDFGRVSEAARDRIEKLRAEKMAEAEPVGTEEADLKLPEKAEEETVPVTEIETGPEVAEVTPEQAEAVAREEIQKTLEEQIQELPPHLREKYETILRNKDFLERISDKAFGKLRQSKLWGRGLDQGVNFLGGVAGGILLRKAVKTGLTTVFGIAGGVGAVAAGGAVGGYRGWRKGTREVYSAKNWLKELEGAEGVELAEKHTAVEKALKNAKIKGNKEEALKLVQKLREVGAILEAEKEKLTEAESADKLREILKQRGRQLKEHTDLEGLRKELYESFLQERNKKVRKQMVRSAAVGAVGGAVGYGIADYLFGSAVEEAVEAREAAKEAARAAKEVAEAAATEQAAEEAAAAAAPEADMLDDLMKEKALSASVGAELAQEQLKAAGEEFLSSLKEGAYEYAAEQGEGYTHIGRKAIHDYLAGNLEYARNFGGEMLHNPETFGREQLIYAEDYIKDRFGEGWLKLGQKVSVDSSLIREALDNAQKLTADQMASIRGKYMGQISERVWDQMLDYSQSFGGAPADAAELGERSTELREAWEAFQQEHQEAVERAAELEAGVAEPEVPEPPAPAPAGEELTGIEPEVGEPEVEVPEPPATGGPVGEELAGIEPEVGKPEVEVPEPITGADDLGAEAPKADYLTPESEDLPKETSFARKLLWIMAGTGAAMGAGTAIGSAYYYRKEIGDWLRRQYEAARLPKIKAPEFWKKYWDDKETRQKKFAADPVRKLLEDKGIKVKAKDLSYRLPRASDIGKQNPEMITFDNYSDYRAYLESLSPFQRGVALDNWWVGVYNPEFRKLVRSATEDEREDERREYIAIKLGYKADEFSDQPELTPKTEEEVNQLRDKLYRDHKVWCYHLLGTGREDAEYYAMEKLEIALADLSPDEKASIDELGRIEVAPHLENKVVGAGEILFNPDSAPEELKAHILGSSQEIRERRAADASAHNTARHLESTYGAAIWRNIRGKEFLEGVNSLAGALKMVEGDLTDKVVILSRFGTSMSLNQIDLNYQLTSEEMAEKIREFLVKRREE